MRISVINSESTPLEAIYNTFVDQGFKIQLFNTSADALPHLNKTDILIVDTSVARQPKSSKFIQTGTILVLTDKSDDQLPPWLQTSHVFLAPYPNNPQDLVDRLADYLPPHLPKFDIDRHNTEHLALLFGITQFLSGHLEVNDLFERILDLSPYLGADFAALLIQESGEIIYYRSTQPGREELIGPAGRRFAQRLLTDGVEGQVLNLNETILIPNTKYDDRWLRASYLPEDQEHCVVFLPINLERADAQGIYMIGHKTAGHFTQKNVPLFKAALTQINLAIENAMLFKNQSQRSIQLALINEVSQAATSILSLDVMLTTVVQAIRRSFSCYSVAIYLYNATTDRVELRAKTTSDRYRATTARWEETQGSPLSHKFYQGLIGWTSATRKTMLANDVTQEPRYVSDGNDEIRAELCVPIALGKKTIGVLDLQSTQLEAFDKYHVSALETLADQLAIAIENARLYDTINQHLDELKSLNEIGQAITSTLDLHKTLTLITNHTTRLINVAAASVVLRDESNNEIWFAAASGEGSETVLGLRMPLGKGIAGWVAERGESVIVPDVEVDQRFFADIDKDSGFTTKSILCVPLQTKGNTIGAIEVMNKKNGTFTQDDLSTLQALAAPAATAIENAQLYEKQIKTIERLAETQSQLIQSAKLAAVGELAAGVAHEINNPLTTIIGLTSLLIDDTPLPDSIKDEVVGDLRMVSDEARRARDIVRSLLDFARADLPQRQPVDFNQIIEDAIFLVFTQNISQRVELKKSLSPLPEIMLDTNQIKQVVVNLLNNAVHAMLENKERPAILSITTELTTSENSYHDTLETVPAQPCVICKITDSGKGILPQHLDKIFDPFFTTKEVGQGTGLGLSISYGIVEQHGGHISVDSTPNKGSTFTLMLPAGTISSSETSSHNRVDDVVLSKS